jgi:hypothetical protein
MNDFVVTTLTETPENVHTLAEGVYFMKHGHDVISITQHRGINVVHQYDLRGPESDEFYETVTIEWMGEECPFNTVDDAREWIDDEVDCDPDHDPVREWGITSSRAV